MQGKLCWDSVPDRQHTDKKKVLPLGLNRVSKGWAREGDGHPLIWRFPRASAVPGTVLCSQALLVLRKQGPFEGLTGR